MNFTVLVDNHCCIDRYYLGEPAVGYLIKDGARTILFDTGCFGAFMKMARRMGIDLFKMGDGIMFGKL